MNVHGGKIRKDNDEPIRYLPQSGLEAGVSEPLDDDDARAKVTGRLIEDLRDEAKDEEEPGLGIQQRFPDPGTG